MKPGWLWDTNISIEEIHAILKDPQNGRFAPTAALLLSRNNTPKEVFDQYLDKKFFVQNWNRIKRQMRKDSWNDPRIIFWQAVYEKLISEFKEKGIAIRPRHEKRMKDDGYLNVVNAIKMQRQEMGWTQNDLAKMLGISQQIISRIEKGRDNVRILTLERIAQVLGMPIEIKPSVWDPNRISNGKQEITHA